MHRNPAKCDISTFNTCKSSPFRSLNVVQVLDVQNHLLGLLLGCLSLILRQLEVSSNHILQRLDIDLKAMTQALQISTPNQVSC